MRRHYTIHTVAILRNEIKMYSRFYVERDKLIQSYVKPLRELYLKLFEVEQKLILIKSPGKGNGLGGYVQESDQRFNDLIQKKEDISLKMIEYVLANRLQCLLYLFCGSRKCKGRLRHNTCGIFAQIGNQCSKFHAITWSGRPFSKWPLSAFAFPAVAAAPPGPRKHSPRFAGASCLHQGNICAGDLRQE